jgi:acid phosphatase family membrane protein YuiD
MPKKDKSIKIPVKKIKKKKTNEVEVLKDLSEAGFEVSHLEEKKKSVEMEAVSKGYIKVKFSKFLKLVSMRDFDELMNLYKDEVLVVDSDLLVDLASENVSEVSLEEDAGDSFSSVLTGVLIGILVSFILFLIFIR